MVHLRVAASIKSSFRFSENLTIDYEDYSIPAVTFSAVSLKLRFSGINFNKMYDIFLFEYIFILKF